MKRVERNESADSAANPVFRRIAELNGRVGREKLGEHLSAGSAGAHRVIGIGGGDGYCLEIPFPLAYGRNKRAAFGADGEAEGSILHIGPRHYGTVATENCRADAEFRVRRV